MLSMKRIAQQVIKLKKHKCVQPQHDRRGGGSPTNEKSGLTIEKLHYAHIDGSKNGADCSHRPSQQRRAGKKITQ